MSIDIDNAIKGMTLDEKCRLIAGKSGWETLEVKRLDIPSITFSDGPHGLRRELPRSPGKMTESAPATCFPTASALACSFDEGLLEQVGRALGEECRDQGVSVLLGPGVNMKRSPLCGRNFEYFSEDPYLAGKLGASYIRGVQSQGVGACLKHLAGNSQERLRMTSDSVIDERTLHELYLRAFEIAIREGHPWVVMGAYNRLNGTWCTENRWLLSDVLRDEWGFDGLVITDWGAENDHLATVPAGCDLVMPGPHEEYSWTVRKATDDGEIDAEDVDRAARHILELVDRCERGRQTIFTCDMHRHLSLARHAAEESAVLLKNDGILPIPHHRTLAVVGAFAKQPRYQGAGSSRVEPIELDCALDALVEMGMDVRYAEGYDPQTGVATEEQIAQAVALASTRDIVVLFMGLPDTFEAEGFDRASLDIPPSHVELLRQLSSVNPHTVVVLQGGAPVDVSWNDLPAAILLMYLSGCQGGHATANLLTGRVTPSGKLAETWPLSLESTPSFGRFSTGAHEVLYAEGLYTGYRYFDSADVPVAYPFGFGLSYTTFEYADLEVESSQDGSFSVTCTIENTGYRNGREVVELFVEPTASGVFKPKRTLQAFASIELAPRESGRVTMHLDARSFSHYDTDLEKWVIEEGDYRLCVGASIADIRLSETVTVPGIVKREFQAALGSYYHPYPGCFTDKAFYSLYGRALPTEDTSASFTPNSTVNDLKSSFIGRIVGGKILHDIKRDSGDDPHRTMMLLDAACETPLRALTMAQGGAGRLHAIMDILNGHIIRGIRTLVRGHRPETARRQSVTRMRTRHGSEDGTR